MIISPSHSEYVQNNQRVVTCINIGSLVVPSGGQFIAQPSTVIWAPPRRSISNNIKHTASTYSGGKKVNYYTNVVPNTTQLVKDRLVKDNGYSLNHTGLPVQPVAIKLR